MEFDQLLGTASGLGLERRWWVVQVVEEAAMVAEVVGPNLK